MTNDYNLEPFKLPDRWWFGFSLQLTFTLLFDIFVVDIKRKHGVDITYELSINGTLKINVALFKWEINGTRYNLQQPFSNRDEVLGYEIQKVQDYIENQIKQQLLTASF